MSAADLILAEAFGWLGTPYHHAARIKGAGVDCAQLLIGVFAGAGLIEAFEPDNYPADWMLHRDEERFRAEVERYADPVEGEPKPGDVVLYKVGRCHAHGAIVVAWPTVIHACIHTGKVTISDGTQGHMAGRDRLFYRVRGV